MMTDRGHQPTDRLIRHESERFLSDRKRLEWTDEARYDARVN